VSAIAPVRNHTAAAATTSTGRGPVSCGQEFQAVADRAAYEQAADQPISDEEDLHGLTGVGSAPRRSGADAVTGQQRGKISKP